MKIAIIVHFFPPKWIRGMEIATYNIARHLTKKGHDIHIITWLDEGLPKESDIEGFHVHRVCGKNIRFLTPLLFWFKIFLCLRRVKPDIVHVQNSGMGIPAYFSKKLLQIPYIIYGRGSDFRFPWISKMGIMQLSIRNADAIIALTQDMKVKMESFYKGEIKVIPNGIELERFIKKEKLTNKIKQNKTIIYVGSLISLKGVNYLIKAIDIVNKKYKNIRLLIIGEGEDRIILENMVKDLQLDNVVKFTGLIPNTELPNYLQMGDIFVLPSLSEGFPNVLLEAMAAGLPIISTNVCGLSEIIKDGENGYLVDPRNHEILAEKILFLVQNPKIQERISNNNLKEIMKYSWSSVTEQIEQIYYSIKDL